MVQAPSLMQFLIVVLAAWLARRQDAFIEYLKAENRMLKARLGRRRIIFSDAERRLLARNTATPEEWPALSSGYRLEIERMQGEVLDYLVQGAPADREDAPA